MPSGIGFVLDEQTANYPGEGVLSAIAWLRPLCMVMSLVFR